MKIVGDGYFLKTVTEPKEEQILVVGGSGKGKTLLAERIIYSHYIAGWQIIIASDQKELLELGFMTFPQEIMKPYHRKALKHEGQQAIRVPLKIFHPFTFDLPSHKIPETNFFTFPIESMGDSEFDLLFCHHCFQSTSQILNLPIESMGDSEFDLLIESNDDKTTRELLLQARDELQYNEGLWHFMKRVESLTDRKIKKSGSKEIKLPDQDRFCLRGVSGGDVRNLDSIERAFHRFQKHLFLTPIDSSLNLDWKNQIFNNQKEVKIFTTKYISKDKKTKDFFTLMLLNQLVENAHHSNEKILVVLDEIKDLVPRSNTGYNQILAEDIARHLNTSFRARGIGSVSTSQSFAGISKTLLKQNVFTITIMMYVDSEDDIKNLRDVYGLNNKHIDAIQNLGQNEFFLRGIPNSDIKAWDLPHKALMPPFPHAEPQYQFDQFYKRYFSDKLKSYNSLKQEQRRIVDSWINELMQEAREQASKEQEEADQLKKTKATVKKLKEELQQKEKQKQSKVQKKREQRDLEIVEKYQIGSTQQELAKEYKMSQPGIRKILIREGVIE